MKKLLTVLTLLIFGFIMLPTLAFADTEHIQDDADLFNDSQTAQLEEAAASLSEEIKGGIYVYTTFDYVDDMETASDNYLREKVGNDNNGAVLMIDMNNRKYHFAASGNMSDFITDNRRASLLESVQANLADGNNFAAAQSYLEDATKFVKAGVPGGHYYQDRETGKITYYHRLTFTEGAIAVAIAFVAALAFFIIIKSRYQLKMGTYKYPYQQNSEVNLTVNENRLVRSFVTTRPIPKMNNISGGGGGGGGGTTTHSSGGGTFSGGGGSF